MIKGKIFAVKRFAVHDGDGIRTTIFLKGCSLSCVWCHNPEGLTAPSELAYYADKCIGCGSCVPVCPAGAHRIDGEGIHRFLRDKCVACGACESACLGEALEYFGRETNVDELMPVLLEDRAFYENSGGGVTLSGGECLCQSEFCAALGARLKAEGVSVAIDTCGFVPRAAIDRVLGCADVFLYDVKAADEDVHIRCTGQPNGLILDNLRHIDEKGKDIEIRIPLVPGYNDDQIEKIGRLLLPLSHVKKIRVLPYHNFAGSKYEALGRENTMPRVPLPTDDDLRTAVGTLSSMGLPAVSARPLKP